MYRIVTAKPLEGYRMWLRYSDGTEGTVDLSDLVGDGVFSIWNDKKVFDSATIGSMGELQWGEEVDLCPDSLYLKLTNKEPEDIFPNLKKATIHA